MCLCVLVILPSGAEVESAHWLLTVDAVTMVKVACLSHLVPPSFLPVATLQHSFLFLLSVVTQGNVTPPSHYLLTYCLTKGTTVRECTLAMAGECTFIITCLIYMFVIYKRRCETDF